MGCPLVRLLEIKVILVLGDKWVRIREYPRTRARERGGGRENHEGESRGTKQKSWREILLKDSPDRPTERSNEGKFRILMSKTPILLLSFGLSHNLQLSPRRYRPTPKFRPLYQTVNDGSFIIPRVSVSIHSCSLCGYHIISENAAWMDRDRRSRNNERSVIIFIFLSFADIRLSLARQHK